MILTSFQPFDGFSLTGSIQELKKSWTGLLLWRSENKQYVEMKNISACKALFSHTSYHDIAM